jgi:rhodanese-related sulfurtransferase
MDKNASLEAGVTLIDTRPGDAFKAGHLPGAINIMLHEGKFETWLGSIVGPEEPFYLICANPEDIETAITKTSKIGYEANIKGALENPESGTTTSPHIDAEAFKSDQSAFNIIDIRNYGEVRTTKVFDNAVNIPLPELRERAGEIATDKPIVIHCAGGYRSAAGQSIVEQVLTDVPVYDLSTLITEYTAYNPHHV